MFCVSFISVENNVLMSFIMKLYVPENTTNKPYIGLHSLTTNGFKILAEKFIYLQSYSQWNLSSDIASKYKSLIAAQKWNKRVQCQQNSKMLNFRIFP